MRPELPVAVIGGGPVGLAAAAHLAERGEAFVVLESGAAVGHSMRQWGHVRVFSPWRYNVDRAARRLLESAGGDIQLQTHCRLARTSSQNISSPLLRC